MSNKKDIDEINLSLDDYQEIEDYTVEDVFEIVDAQEQEKLSKRESAREKKRAKMKKRKRIKIVLLVLEILVVLILGLVATVLLAPEGVRNNLISCVGKCAGQITGLEGQFDDKFTDEIDEEKIDVNEGINKEQFEDYITIALFGIDSRHNSLEVGLSDSIIIATINTKSKEVRMSSIARDTYLSVIDGDGDATLMKITEAFGKEGGVENSLTNLNRNLDLSIDEYAVVNFAGLATIIDAFGGIDVTISEDERFYINGYLVETREVTGMDAPDVTKSGRVHLNGLQATAFCRIRQVMFTDEDGSQYNDDFGRTARQRYVIRFLINRAKQLGVDNVVDIANALFGESTPAFKTSMTYDEIMDLLPVVIQFSLAGTESFPYTYVEPDRNLIPGGASVVGVCGLTYNVTKLHEFLYPDQTYKPTTTLKTISNDIAFRTNVDEVKLPEDQ